MLLPGLMGGVLLGGEGGGGGASPSPVATAQVALNTTTGTQDITVSGFGTPVGAIIWCSSAQPADTSVNGISGSIGAADGTREWVNAWSLRNGASTSRTRRRAAKDAMVMLMDQSTGGVVVEAAFSSFISDGIRINVSTTNGTAYIANVMLIGGAGVSVHADTITGPTSGGSVTASPGFETAGLLTALAYLNADDTPRGTTFTSIGFGSWDGATARQASAMMRSTDGVSTTENIGEVRDDAVVSFPSSNRRVAFGSVTSTGFDLAATGFDFSGSEIHYLAISGIQAHAEVGDTPTSTGSANMGSAAFTPQAALMQSTLLTAVNSVNTTGDGGAWGFPIMANDDFTIAFAEEDGASIANTRCRSSTKAVIQDVHTGGAALQADHTGWASGAAVLDWTQVQASARKFPLLLMAAE